MTLVVGMDCNQADSGMVYQGFHRDETGQLTMTLEAQDGRVPLPLEAGINPARVETPILFFGEVWV